MASMRIGVLRYQSLEPYKSKPRPMLSSNINPVSLWTLTSPLLISHSCTQGLRIHGCPSTPRILRVHLTTPPNPHLSLNLHPLNPFLSIFLSYIFSIHFLVRFLSRLSSCMHGRLTYPFLSLNTYFGSFSSFPLRAWSSTSACEVLCMATFSSPFPRLFLIPITFGFTCLPFPNLHTCPTHHPHLSISFKPIEPDATPYHWQKWLVEI